MSFELLLVTVGLAGLSWLYAFTRQMVKSQARTRSVDAKRTIPVNLLNNDGAVVVAEGRGHLVYISPRAAEWFELSGIEPNLTVLASRVQPADVFHDLFAEEGRALLRIGMRRVEAASHAVPTAEGQRFVVFMREVATSAEEDLFDTARALTVVQDISKTITIGADLGQTMTTILTSISSVIEYDAGEVILWDQTLNRPRPVGQVGNGYSSYMNSNSGNGHSNGTGVADFDAGYTAWIARYQQPLLLNDVSVRADVGPRSEAFPYQSYIGVPLTVSGRFIGTIELASNKAHAFTHEDLRLLESVAGQAAVAIENTRLSTEQANRVLQLNGLQNIAQTMGEQIDARELYQRLHERIASLMNVEICGLLLYDSHADALVSQLPFFGVTDAIMSLYRLPVSTDTHAYRIWQGEAWWYSNRVLGDEMMSALNLRGLAETIGIRNAAMIPIGIGRNRIGMLLVGNKRDGANFTDDDMRLGAIFAAQAAIVVENANLYERERRYIAELANLQQMTQAPRSHEGTLIAQITERVAQLLNVEMCGILLYENDQKLLVAQSPFFGIDDESINFYQIPIESDSIFTELQQGQEYWYSNELGLETWPGARSFAQLANMVGVRKVLFATLIVGDVHFGVLQVANRVDDRNFGREDGRILSLAARQAAVLLDNAELHREVDRLSRETQGLQRIAERIADQLTQQEVFDAVLDEMRDIMQSEQVAIGLLDTKHGKLLYTSEMMRGATLSESPYEIDIYSKNFSYSPVMSRKPYLTTDIQSDPNVLPAYRDLAERINIQKDVLIVPLISNQRAIGELAIGSRRKGRYSSSDEQLLLAIGAQIAAALERARLYSITDADLRARVEEQEAIDRINRELSETLLLIDRVLEVIRNEALATTNAVGVSVGLMLPRQLWMDADVPELETRLGGDSLFANIDDPTVLHHLVSVEKRMLDNDDTAMVEDYHGADVEAVPAIARSAIVEPIRFENEVVGFIHLYSDVPSAFSPATQSFVKRLGQQASLAITNARRYRDQVQANDRLKRRADQMQSVFRLSDMVRRGVGINILMEELAKNLRDTAGFEQILIRVLNSREQTFDVVNHLGIGAEAFNDPSVRSRSMESVTSLLDPRWKTGAIFFFPADFQDEWRAALQEKLIEDPLKHASGTGPRRWSAEDLLVVPVYGTDQTLIGTISLDDPINGLRPTRELIDLLEVFATQAAFAIENYRLVETIRQQAEDARRERDRLAQLNLASSEIQRATDMTGRLRAVATAINAAGWQHVQLTLRDPHLEPTQFISIGYTAEEEAQIQRTLTPGSVWQERFTDLEFNDLKMGSAYYLRYDSEWVVKNIRRGEPASPASVDEDAWHPQDVIYLPLMGHDQKRIIGLIRLDSPVDGKRPNEQTLQPIELFALQASAAIENQRLYTETVRQADIEQQLNRLMEAMAATLDQAEIILALSEGLQPFVLYTHMHLAIRSDAEPDLFEMTRVELTPDGQTYILPDNPIPLQGTAAGDVYYTGQTQNFDLKPSDAETYDFTDLQTWAAQGERSVLIVPMIAGGDRLGVMRLGSELDQAFRFADNQTLTLIQRMANLATVSIQNSRLFNNLGESQSFNEAVVQSIQQGIVVLDEHLRVRIANQYMMTHYGWTYQSIGSSLFDYRVGLFDSLSEPIREVLEEGRNVQRMDITLAGQTIDTDFLVNFYIYPLRQGTRVNGAVLLIEDITQRAQLEADVRRRADQLSALTNVSSSMTETLQPDQVVEVVLDALDEVIPYDGVVLWLEHPTRRNSLQIVAARGFDDPGTSSVEDLIKLWIDIDDSLLFKEMAAQRQVVNVGDTANDISRFPTGGDRPYRCFLAAPLISKGEIIGVLQLEKRETFFYDQNYEQLALAFANQAAVALNNATLFAETQERAEELDRQAGRLALLNRVSNSLSQSLDIENIFEITVRETARALEVDEAAAIQINADDGICRVIIEHPRGSTEPSLAFRLDDSGAMRQIRDKMVPILYNHINQETPDVQADLRSLLRREDIVRTLFIPLVVSGKVIGTMRLDGGPESKPFTSEQIDLAQTIASQASIAVQNASLYEQSLQRTYQLETLFEAGQATSGAIDVDDVLRRVATQMLIALRADSTEIMRWDQLENCLIVDQAKSSWLDDTSTSEVRGLVYDLNTFPLRRIVLQDHQVLTLRIDDRDLDASERSHMEVHGVTNRILVPLVVNEVSIGITQVDIRDETRFIDANQVRLVRVLANQAAVAIENARLQSETRSQIEELYLINELAKSVSSTVDVNELFKQVEVQLPLLTDAQYLYVAVYDRSSGKLSFPIALDDLGKSYNIEPFVPSAHDEFGYIIRTQNPLLLAGVGLQDVRKQFGITEPMFPDARSFLGVPMIAGESFVGIVALRDDLESRKFDYNSQRILSTVSSQIAVTLQNANLFARITDFANELNVRVEERTAQLVQERQRLTTLYEIASEIAAATLDLDRVLNRTLEAVADAIGARSGIVLAIDDISDMLYVIAQRGLDVSDESERLQLRQNEGLAGWVIQHRQGVVINDVQNDPRWITITDRDRAPRSAIATLLESADDVRGVIMFYSDRKDAFNDDHLRLVTAASLQLANSMNNAELYSLIRDQAERLGAILRQEQVESTKTAAILNSVADGVMYANEKGIIRVFNNTASQILGLASERVLNRHLSELTGVYGGRESGWMDVIDSWMADPTQHVSSDFVEFLLSLDDGRVINVRLSPVNMGDQFLGTVSVFRDITSDVEVDRLKSEFVATVSHELRTPMTSIKGYADLLLLGAAGALTEPQQRFLQTIKQNADRLSILVNDLLEVSRIDQGQMQLRFSPIQVDEVLQTLNSHLAGRIGEAERDMQVDVSSDPNMPPIRGDFDRIIQIMQNLADNAFNYSQDPCTVYINARYNAGKNTIILSVRDQGIGIPAEIRDRIFERFFRGDEHSELVMDTPGTGLGLAIVKELVTMHNGDIWFETQLGEGTTFYVELPVYTDEEPEA